jgi:CheY-like chemotaxis protein
MARPTVLIVDEDADCVALVQSLLESAGYRVLVAVGGENAFEIAKSAKPDLVLLDLATRQHDEGHEFLRALRALPELARTPVIVVTSVYTNRPAFQIDPGAGYLPAQLMLPKPVDPQQLLAEVGQLVGAGVMAEQVNRTTP